jgi:hypothetical protein
MITMDFPNAPVLGQVFINEAGIAYTWNGTAWDIGAGVPGGGEQFNTLGGVLNQIRVLLQDTDVITGKYRYPTPQIVANINMGMIEMYRLRPDIFMENGFQIPTFNSLVLDDPMKIEPQYVPPLIYYTVGLTQLRDDEQTQDQRAVNFMKTFAQTLTTIG